MITTDELVENYKMTAKAAKAALAPLDQQADFDALRKTVKVSIWDRESAINDVSADYWLGREDVGDGEIYIIEVGDRTFFQPHAPGIEGHAAMTPDDVMGIANAHADELAWEAVRAAAFDIIKDALPKVYSII